MYKYKVYGMIFESDLELPECEQVDEGVKAEVLVKYDNLQDMVDELQERRAVLSEDPTLEGELPSSYKKVEKGVYSSYIVGIVYVRIVDDKVIYYRPEKPLEDVVFHQWMLCFAMTIALIKKHEIILHCAGLLIPGTDDVALVCGDSGAGKSTISNALLDKGFLFVSDDSVRVADENGEAKVYGSYKQRRLCEDVVEKGNFDKSKLQFYREGKKNKWALNMGDAYYGNTPHRFRYLFFMTLKETGRVDFKEITGAAKISQIMRALYKTGAYKDEGLTAELFVKFASIAKDVKVFVVERPTDKQTVEEITETIIKEVTRNKQ